jgi:PPOX class probable F420-dependent enzyme
MPARMTRAQRERFLRGRHVAVLVSIGPDGAPVPVPIWYLYRDGLLYFRTAANAVKTYNVQRDPRVAVVVQDDRAPYKSVTAYGTVEVREEVVEGIENDIPRHYLGFVGAIGYQATTRSQIEAGVTEVTLVVRPQRYVTQDFTPDTPIVGRAWLLLRRVLPPWL